MTEFSADDVGRWMATELDQSPKDELRQEVAVQGIHERFAGDFPDDLGFGKIPAVTT